MKFNPAAPNESLTIARWVSSEGKWEIGYRQMLFGVRVSLTRIGDYWFTLDYCASDQSDFAVALLVTVMHILERYPEDVRPNQLEKDFPKFQVKPINRDPHCWKRLQEMAGLSFEGFDDVDPIYLNTV